MTGTTLRSSLLGAAALAALTACSTINVRSDSSAAADLRACHTFSWIETPAANRPDAFGNPLNDKRLRDAVSQRLQSRGMTVATAGSGDCQVGYVFGSRTSGDDYDRPRFSFGIGTGWGGRGRNGTSGSIFWDNSAPYAYRENRVSVDLYRSGSGPAGHEPLWHASVDMDLTRLTGAEAEKRIDAAVAAMFTKFPSTR